MRVKSGHKLMYGIVGAVFAAGCPCFIVADWRGDNNRYLMGCDLRLYFSWDVHQLVVVVVVVVCVCV